MLDGPTALKGAMTCPDCHKLASPSTPYPSSNHYTHCPQFDALKEKEYRIIPAAVLFRRRAQYVYPRYASVYVKEERELWTASLDADIAGCTALDAGQEDEAACHFARADCFRRLRQLVKVPHGR